MKLVAISGSLRSGSSNTVLLRAMSQMAPKGVAIELYEGIGRLPFFNPDIEDVETLDLADFRRQIREADGVLFSSPEYAHGVPGVLKNALDWLVGGSEIVDKPVAVINASPHSFYAHASLLETLRIMSSKVVAAASVTVPLAGKKLNQAGIISHPEIGPALRASIDSLVAAIMALQTHKPN